MDRNALAELCRKYRVPGAQLAVHRAGRTVAIETGEATYGTGRALTRADAFPVGSLTKPFTATLAMALVADGDVELDAPLAEYLPGPDVGITLRQVLSHTAGLASGMPEHTDHHPTGLVHPPGTVFSYSNPGYLLAARLVTAVTGLGWWDAVEAILLHPLGIEPAFVVDHRTTPTRPVVDGHTVRPGRDRVVPITDQALPAAEAPAAGLALSAEDLVVFARAHLADVPPLLDPHHAREMRRDQVAGLAVGPFPMADGWGLGWSLYRAGEWCGHDGTGSGTWAHLRFDPADGTVVALTTNADTGQAMWDALVTELRATGLDVGNYSLSAPGPPVPGPVECVGRYVNGELDCVVEHDGGHLYLLIGGKRHSRLTCFDHLRFTMRELDGGQTALAGRFVRDPDTGTVELLQFAGRLARRHRGTD